MLRTISSQKELRSRRRRPQTSKVAHKSFNQFSMAEETESKFHSNAGGEIKVLTSHSPSQLSSVQNVRQPRVNVKQLFTRPSTCKATTQVVTSHRETSSVVRFHINDFVHPCLQLVEGFQPDKFAFSEHTAKYGTIIDQQLQKLLFGSGSDSR